MKIIIEDGFTLQQGTGIGQYTLNLYHHLKNAPEINSIQLIEKPLLSRLQSPALRRMFYIGWLNSGLQLMLRRKKPDIVHFTNYLIPPLRISNVKYVVTIFDLTAWKFPGIVPKNYAPYFKWATLHAIRTADLVLTYTESMKDEIKERFNMPDRKIQTVHVGVDKVFRRLPSANINSHLDRLQKKFSIKPGFILFTGIIVKRKNLITLLKAFSRLITNNDLQLVLVGKKGDSYSEVLTYLKEYNLTDHVILTGYVEKEDLVALYNLARVFVFPSLDEGFGIPLLEAMACGTPIVASRIPSTEEVAGDAVTYYDPPQDDKVLSEAILRLLENKNICRDLVTKGINRVKKFSWEEAARRHLVAYKTLL